MHDDMIQAKADRYVRQLRREFARMGPPIPGDDELIERARQTVVRALSLEKARREKRRLKHEQTLSLFK